MGLHELSSGNLVQTCSKPYGPTYSIWNFDVMNLCELFFPIPSLLSKVLHAEFMDIQPRHI